MSDLEATRRRSVCGTASLPGSLRRLERDHVDDYVASVDEVLQAAIDDYRKQRQRAHARELDYFRLPRLSDEDAIAAAALCQLPSGKRHSHQRRIPRVSLEESKRRLTANLTEIRTCASFDELYELIEQLIRPIHMIGELTVYDTSLRIGARFGLEPERVYLHAGTRVGARRLGLDWKAGALESDALPAPLRILKPREAEDVLCIYDSWFLPR
jgi:hypothetical protein